MTFDFIYEARSLDPAFRILCKKYGAKKVIVQAVAPKDISASEAPVFIVVPEKNASKIVTAFEKDKHCDGFSTTDAKIKTKKTLIRTIDPKDKIPTDATILLINTTNADELQAIKKKTKVPVIARGTFQKAEDAYNLYRTNAADGISISETAELNPVFFEQCQGYFEKGYYNKITRKRREKLVYEYNEICKKYKLKSNPETIQMILKE